MAGSWMRQSPAPLDMLRRPGSGALDWEGEAGRPKPPRWCGHSAAMAWDCGSSASDPASSSPARKAGSASVSPSPVGLRAGLGVGQAQRLGQPARALQQPLGLLGHVGLLEMVDELRRLLALGFAHRLEDASLRHPAEIVVDGRPPAGRRHVEIDGPGQQIAMRQRARPPVPGFLDDVDGERGAVREQRRLAVAVERRQSVPQIGRRFGQLPAPLGVPRLDRLGRRGVRQARRLGAEARMLRRDLQAGVGRVAVEDLEAERMQDRLEGDMRIVRHARLAAPGSDGRSARSPDDPKADGSSRPPRRPPGRNWPAHRRW